MLLGEGARGLFNRFAERGEAAERESLAQIEKSVTEGKDKASDAVGRQVKKVLEGMHLVTREDLEALRLQLAELTERLGQPEAKARKAAK